MSKANRVGKELARQRAAELRLEQQRRARRNRLYAIYGSVVAVIAVAVGVAFAVQAANAPKTPTAVPVGAVADTTGGVSAADGMAIPLGNADAKVKLTVYEDARCSACKSYETTYTPAYKKLIQDGTLELLIHPVTLIDANTNGTGSLHAGNAFACAQDAGHFEDYHDIIYTNQPAETTDSFASDATLIALAKQVQGLDSKTFESCVNSHKYFDWVRQNYANLNKITNNQPSTPTIYANGKAYTLPTGSTTAAAQAAFTASIDKLAGVNPSASPSASASGAGASSSPSAAASPSPSASKS
ncbi:DsbA family protein [Actinocrinis sp.]|uniref:DsbA family protein n=1 Tax=Actinocrinis sp. TaxID=1920516 RepID=UPI002D3D18FF|nr:thioredoxin domain-containing protein [Actinocrinis sp.]HZP53146.1 thioredoxin domain-containing protein [Actinocrinis sp.]